MTQRKSRYQFPLGTRAMVLQRREREKEGERDVENAGTADRPKEANKRGGGAAQEAWHALRDRVLP